ncbi:SPNS [Acanthosepion pharaonis]|uniref:SPNS n=1 Tax=Acanthosepion pharaonis TaxID=158019 RepID=A0A812BBU2_ACAPH|nr:SPNS [Sepia pharaonis]
MKGATLQFATLEAPFDDTVPLDDMSASSPDSPLAPSTAVIVAPPPRSSSSSSLPQQPQSDLVEGQIMPIPEHINNAYDTAPIVDSDEGRSYESEGTTVQTVLPAPVTRAAAFSSVLVLFLINLLNYMDRYTIAGILEDVKSYYSLDNKESGLLQTAFILSYMAFSPIFGYLGDRFNRKYLMAMGILFWSCVTFAGSFIQRDYFSVFLILRALVGIGEASYSTIAPTIIADLYVQESRSKSLMFFYFAIPVGSGLGYIVGSNVKNATGVWQYALRVTPAFGLLCTILILVVVKDPPRGFSEGGTHLRNTSYVTDIKVLLKNKSFLLSSVGFTCVAFVTGALALWAPIFMLDAIRTKDVNADEAAVSLRFGIITCMAGFVGVAIGSESARRYKKINPRADPLICAMGLLSCTPFIFFALLISQYHIIMTWVLIFIGETLLCLNWAIVADILLYTVIPTRRSLAESFQIVLSHLFGDAGSPYIVGLISDSLVTNYPDVLQNSYFVQFATLRNALYMTSFVCVLGGASFLATAIFVEKDKARVDNLVRGIEDESDEEPSPPDVL